jgi:hypothetical protein
MHSRESPSYIQDAVFGVAHNDTLLKAMKSRKSIAEAVETGSLKIALEDYDECCPRQPDTTAKPPKYKTNTKSQNPEIQINTSTH